MFADVGRFRVQQSVYTASFVVTLLNKKGTVLGVAVGPHAGGRIDGLRDIDERWQIDPGVVWAFTVARRWFGSKPEIPFLLLVGTFSGSWTRTTRASDQLRGRILAFDSKIDLAVGWTLGEAFSPYLSVRGFGGPVLWRQQGHTDFGGDLYHVSLACGFNLAVGERASAFFDGAFLGARGLSGGFGLRF